MTRNTSNGNSVKPRKSLGQHFLTDSSVITGLVEAAELKPGELVIEIGPGLGALTKVILQHPIFLAVIELDRRLADILENRPGSAGRLLVIHGDALKMDFRQGLLQGLDAMFRADRRHTTLRARSAAWEAASFTGIKVVANIPYYITTPLVMKWLHEASSYITRMVLTMQREVSERMLALPGAKAYGTLSVSTRFFAQAERIMDIPPACFYPRPGVMSSAMRLDLLPEPSVKTVDRDLYFRVVRAAFNQRRKTLLNALSAVFHDLIGKQDLGGLLLRLGIDPGRRGETLNPEEFAILADGLAPFRNAGMMKGDPSCERD